MFFFMAVSYTHLEIIEVLLYAMRLKAVGIEDRKIQEGIIKIMGFNFALD